MKNLLTFKEISEQKAEGSYIAVCESGKRYPATYVNEYTPDGVMFFCMPASETIIGYEKI